MLLSFALLPGEFGTAVTNIHGSANQMNRNKQNPSLNTGGDRWQPPEGGLYKVNCDALVDKDGGKTGFGVVIRDEEGNGNVLASCAQTLVANLSIKAAKLTAVLKSQHNLSENSGLPEDIYSLVANLRNAKFVHTSCKANCVAQRLAAHALKSDEDAFWMEEAPTFVNDLVID
ncbi:hypothetical protein Dsin_018738 [Dipteronia sinensis]|uniref:RNase H type-1 domain-containing protein n=1 Tax=Dipteronia sinensis TaxID=43782 RepID=A0AAE0A5V7_9ROSI|nr:hypothetical protein Dsin_018738 [Dipteronia sinensis]